MRIATACAAILVLTSCAANDTAGLATATALGGSSSPITSATPMTASPTPTTASPTPDEVTPSPSASASQPSGGQRCTNDRFGFTVAYPADWYTNAEIDQEFAEPTPACTYFGEQPMEIGPNAGVPPTVVITFARWTEVPPSGESWDVIFRDETEVARMPALVIEEEQMSDAGAPFSARGDRSYAYRVELPDGTVIVAGTRSTADGDYTEHRDVLDAMMATLELTGGGEPREPQGPLGP